MLNRSSFGTQPSRELVKVEKQKRNVRQQRLLREHFPEMMFAARLPASDPCVGLNLKEKHFG